MLSHRELPLARRLGFLRDYHRILQVTGLPEDHLRLDVLSESPDKPVQSLRGAHISTP